MEFYLVSDLGCELIVFLPYRTLLTLCGREAAHAVVSEAGEVGVGIDNGPRYWGTGEGRLELEEGPLQTAWHVIRHSLIPRPSKLMCACAQQVHHQRHIPFRALSALPTTYDRHRRDIPHARPKRQNARSDPSTNGLVDTHTHTASLITYKLQQRSPQTPAAHATAAAGLCRVHGRLARVVAHGRHDRAGNSLALHAVGTLFRCCARVGARSKCRGE